ncbi:MAG: diaminopimelate epimerase [Clostridiaceae bacterium]|jgi:diaminopimelate epimerase|nr:diaminopimelate epimerase [Clostridiaceae bacterium]
MRFTKMHGLGNDYVYINCFEEKVENPSELAKFVSHRHFGVGSDGLVLILPSQIADFRMRMFNSDGSEAEMCGNAIRCVGKYVYDNKMTDKKTITIETLAGIKTLELTIDDDLKVSLVKVDMGEPVISPKDIPVDSNLERFINEPVKILDEVYRVTCVSMGNPHAVTFVQDVKNFSLEKVGPLMETHLLFPNKINAEFVEIVNKTHLKMRVWERGAGETMACGTGACAVLVAAHLNGLSERKATIELLGGNLTIEWNKENNRIYKTGPATLVFTGLLNI